MIILCVGCSFTAERYVEGQSNSWVRQLAKQHPKHIFFNCASSGASLLHCIWTAENFKKQCKVDKTIFQITLPARLTYYTDLPENYNIREYLKHDKNYFWLDLPLSKIHTVNPITAYESQSDTLKSFAKDYYNKLATSHHFNTEHAVGVDYVKRNYDFVFQHTGNIIPGIINLKSELGEETFKSYCTDEGSHFGNDGINWESNFLNSKLF